MTHIREIPQPAFAVDQNALGGDHPLLARLCACTYTHTHTHKAQGARAHTSRQAGLPAVVCMHASADAPLHANLPAVPHEVDQTEIEDHDDDGDDDGCLVVARRLRAALRVLVRLLLIQELRLEHVGRAVREELARRSRDGVGKVVRRIHAARVTACLHVYVCTCM
jgi:hypothetical protein